MSPSIHEILQEDNSPEANWLSALGSALEQEKSWVNASLAQAEFEEGLYLDEDEAWELSKQEVAALAADDQKPLQFPTNYHGGPWRIVLKRRADGRPVLRIDQGSDNAEILIQDDWVHFKKGQEVEVDLDEPPLQLHIRILGEGSWLLWPR